MVEVPVHVANRRYAPEKGLIDQLESLLEMARDGRLRALAYAAVLSRDLNEQGFTQWNITLTPNTVYAMSHGIMSLQHQWLDHTTKLADPVRNPGDPLDS